MDMLARYYDVLDKDHFESVHTLRREAPHYTSNRPSHYVVKRLTS